MTNLYLPHIVPTTKPKTAKNKMYAKKGSKKHGKQQPSALGPQEKRTNENKTATSEKVKGE